MVEVGPVRHVADAIGLEREQRPDVVRRRYPDRVDADQRADVLSDLVG